MSSTAGRTGGWSGGWSEPREEPTLQVSLSNPPPVRDIGGAVAMTAAHFNNVLGTQPQLSSLASLLLASGNTFVQCCPFGPPEFEMIPEKFAADQVRRWVANKIKLLEGGPVSLIVQILHDQGPNFMTDLKSAIYILNHYLLMAHQAIIYVTSPTAADPRMRTPRPLLIIRKPISGDENLLDGGPARELLLKQLRS